MDFAGFLAGLHSGGMGNEPTFYRFVPNLDMLPRHHTGLGPGERLSVTTIDEMELTPGQQKAFFNLARASAATSGVKAAGGGGDNYNINIYAVDSKSFADICERNPAALITPISKAMKYGQLKDWREMLGTKR